MARPASVATTPVPASAGTPIPAGAAPVFAEPDPNDPLSGLTLGGCLLIRKLGGGALGMVYEARDVKNGDRRVAMKILHSKAAENPEMVKRFEREAALCLAIKHPNVVSTYDSGCDDGTYYISMEFVDGSDLQRVITKSGKMEWKMATEMILQLTEALGAIHTMDILHRDIKPLNILVNSSGVAKIADLGLGKQLNAAQQDEGAALTMAGAAMGSPDYMAPEQIRDSSSVTPQADIYALGATFYHMLVGRPPHTGKNAAEVMTKVLGSEPPPVMLEVPEVPLGVSDLVDYMIAKDATQRVGDCAELAEAIRAVQANPAKPAPRKHLPSAGGSMNLTVILAVVAVLLLIGAAVWYFFFRS